MMIDEFLKHVLLVLLPKFQQYFNHRNMIYEHRLEKMVLTYSTISIIAHHSVCLICAIQNNFHVKNRNYLKNVWLRRHLSRSRFRKENLDFRNSNTAILAILLK